MLIFFANLSLIKFLATVLEPHTYVPRHGSIVIASHWPAKIVNVNVNVPSATATIVLYSPTIQNLV